MHTALCDQYGIQYPIFVFTPSEKVAAAVTRAGGMGVLGCVRFNDPDELESVLNWMDANTLGKPYGVDIVMPATVPTEGTTVDINKLIPQTHRDFVAKTLADLGVPPLPDDGAGNEGVLGWLHSVARSHVDVALGHRISLIANALGSPPADVLDQVRRELHGNERVELEFPARGGHVGFTSGRRPWNPWYYGEWRAAEFLSVRLERFARALR